ncbi:oligopeptide:H+ symporter [Shewanella sp. AS16]|uniref:peptide MFS transporter n=1 Tax=Shewanella sp. AS16 TaxID=2907625 RepID=UPI001F3FB04B|nr:oligopeptide:H+ symporter [Shewanella sp. AS16]MCE9685018.1 oligopeptide:H+ symporter [Shewanella sp. AS16]
MSAELNEHFPQDLVLGHPKGLFVCFFTEMWERFSFYGMKALLFLYLIKYHLFSDEYGYNVIGAYGALVYAMPVIGGLLADRYLGMRKAVVFGGILLVLGHLGMAFEGHQAMLVAGEVVRDEQALQVFYFSLSLIIVGVGFLKPNISTIVGQLYPPQDPRRDSGFTIFYAGINLGATIAPLICAYLGETYGWKYGFGLAGIGMLTGLLVFIRGQKYLQGHAEPREPQKLLKKTAGIRTEYWIYLGGLGSIFLVWGLVQTHSILIAVNSLLPAVSPVLWFLHSITLVLTLGIGWFMIKHCNSVERQQMLTLILFIIAGLMFFGLYEQTYGSWVAFSDRVMDRSLFGLQWSAGQLTFLGAFFVITLSPLFAWLWPALAQRNWDPSKPVKMALGLMFAGLSFMILVLGIQLPLASGLVSIWFLIGAYFVLEIGELLLSPIGLSAVTQLSVKRVVSLMMGAWFLGTSYSEILAAELNKLAAIDTQGGVISDIAGAMSLYEQLFIFSAQIGIVVAAVFLVLAPLMKRMMHEKD